MKRAVWMVMAGVCCAALWAGDWPGWKGADRSAAVESEGTFKFGQNNGLKVNWKSKLGPSYSSISIVGNQAVTMFSDGTTDYIVNLDSKTGTERWRYAIEPAWKSIGPDHDGPNSSPLMVDDVIYGLGARGSLFALDQKTGKELWKTHLVDEHQATMPLYGFTTSPLMVGSMLIVETGQKDKMISGFHKDNGKEIWSTGADQVQYQSPVFAEFLGKKQLLASGDKTLMGINPGNGTTYWTYDLGGNYGGNSPLVIGDDRLFVRKNRTQAMMLKLSDRDGKVEVAPLWTSRLSFSWAETVYHNGYLYGFSGRFLTCLNAEDGAQMWKSRQPGDGFPILVDDQLVVLTKSGDLSVIKASPQSFQELASIKLFDSLAWTPPSFANGTLFARSLEEIAAVVMSEVPTAIERVAQQGPQTKLPDTRFGQFIKRLEQSDKKQDELDAFLKENPTSPIIEDKAYAHIIYRGNPKDLTIVGDMLEFGAEGRMNRVAGTDFFYASFALKPDTRVNYMLIENLEDRIVDPLNPNNVPSIFGDMSQLAMPGWSSPAHLDGTSVNQDQKGSLVARVLESKVFNDKRKLQVYLPKGYEGGEERYPVVYVNYGDRAIQMGLMNHTLDHVIGKTVKPTIAVFIETTPAAGRELARTGRDQFAEWVAKEVVPYVDGQFRTVAKPSHRGIMGGDEGGYAAIYAAFKFPGTFGKVAGQSTHLLNGNGGEEINAIIKDSPQRDVAFYLDWGRYDYRNRAQNFNWITLNETFAEMLKERGYEVTHRVHNEGWGWANWRNHTDDVLEFFFPLNVK